MSEANHPNPRSDKPSLASFRREPADYLKALKLTDLPVLICPSRVGEILDVSQQSVHRLIQRGELASVRLGPQTCRVFTQSLVDLLTRNLE